MYFSFQHNCIDVYSIVCVFGVSLVYLYFIVLILWCTSSFTIGGLVLWRTYSLVYFGALVLWCTVYFGVLLFLVGISYVKK
jgi:hypothetical protein